MSVCRVCGNMLNNSRHVFQEKYLGLHDAFDYIECGVCKSISIVEQPNDIERYYPESYYSYSKRHCSRLSAFLKGRRDRQYLGKTNTIGYLLSLVLAPPLYIEWLRLLELPTGSSILDVGSGSGTLIINLQSAGYLTLGIDPYITAPVSYPNGAKVLKQSLEEVTDKFDCIMLHHCLEHMLEPQKVFEHMRRVLKPGGKVLIRIPVANAFAWKKYGSNWFQLDAPRHAVIFSEAGFCDLALKNKFQICRIVYDSNASQFWASEQYKNNITLSNLKSQGLYPEKSLFSTEEINEYEKEAVILNDRKDGDQAAFYLAKVS